MPLSRATLAALTAVAAGAAATTALATVPVTVAPATATLAAPEDAADTDTGMRWAVQPSGPDGPTGRSWFVYDLAPGEEIVDWVAVTNYSEIPLDFQVYATDAYTTQDGGFALLTADGRPRDVGAWVALDSGTYQVPAGHRLDIPFRVVVPDNATPGDHAGGIVASVTTRRSDATGQQVDLDQRVAARVYLRVSGPAAPELRVESVRVAYTNPVAPWDESAMTVTYVLRNTGNLRVSGTARVRVDGPFGWRLAASGDADVPELLPGSTVTVTETVTGLAPAVRLAATVEVDPVTDEAALPRVTRTATAWAVPWLILAALVAVAGYLLVRRHRRRRAATP